MRGAWIETLSSGAKLFALLFVAPHAGGVD